MEIIQWFTSGPSRSMSVEDVKKRPDTTFHCLFRLDALDLEVMGPELTKELRNDAAKIAAEEGTRVDKTLSVRISEDDETSYKYECIKTFGKLLGVDVKEIFN
jgi:hypothetical protein